MEREAPSPLSRPAANKRSPNRKPRVRSVLRNSDVQHRKDMFLSLLRSGVRPKEATQKVGEEIAAPDLGLSYFWHWRERSPEFREEWEKAVEESNAYDRLVRGPHLEEEADRRAVDGVLEADYYQGEVVGHTRKYSDGLLTTRLKAVLPEKYRESAQGGVTVDNRTQILNLKEFTLEELRELLGKAEQ